MKFPTLINLINRGGLRLKPSCFLIGKDFKKANTHTIVEHDTKSYEGLYIP